MAESVQFLLERMVPELQDLEERGLFNKAEIKAIVARRTDSEYKLRRRIGRKADYLRYIQAEMNLERLRARRRTRLEIGGSSVSDFSLQQRIHFLFVRALRKFNGDVRLWLQHIEYCRQTHSQTLLLRAYAGAIQSHPLEPGFWIMAAAYEFEELSDVKAARSLLHRALRLMRESTTLWLEYCRLELVFLYRMRERRRILGVAPIDAPASSKSVELGALPMEASASELRGLPDTDGAHSPDFFDGAIPLSVYRNAIKSNPSSIEFRLSFVRLFAQFDGMESCIDAVYASIQEDFGTLPSGIAAVALRPLHLVNWAAATATSADAALREADKRIAAASKKCPQVWAEAASAYAELQKERIDELGLGPSVSAKFIAACESAASADVALPVALYTAWYDALLSTSAAAARWSALRKALISACDAHPTERALWTSAVKAQLREKSGAAAVEPMLRRALAALPEAEAERVVHAYLEHVAAHGDASSAAAAFEQWATYGRRSHGSLCILYVEWALKNGGIAQARAVYDALLALPGAPVELVTKCLEIEAAAVETTEPARRRALHVAATAADPANADLWLDAIAFELNAGEFERANQLYWRALKAVKDAGEFIARYNAVSNA